MRQQVNLYQAALKPKRGWRSLQNLLICWLLMLAVMLVWLANKQHTLAETTAKTLSTEEAVQLLKLAHQQKSGKQAADRTALTQAQAKRHKLEQSVTELRQQTKHFQALLFNEDVMAAARPAIDFAAILNGLSRQHINGLWLTQFQVTENGVTLHGAAKDAALLPKFAQRLGTEAAFEGHRFNQLSLVPQSGRQNDVLSFSMGSAQGLQKQAQLAASQSDVIAQLSTAPGRAHLSTEEIRVGDPKQGEVK